MQPKKLCPVHEGVSLEAGNHSCAKVFVFPTMVTTSKSVLAKRGVFLHNAVAVYGEVVS